MGVPARRQHSFQQYLELEEASNTKHEYYAGEIYGMAGSTPEHAALAMSIGAELLRAARGSRCRVYSSDLRIRVPETGLATYPDVTVACRPSPTIRRARRRSRTPPSWSRF
jgi:Uma2 family endonuclease